MDKNGRDIRISSQNCLAINPVLEIIQIMGRHQEYMTNAPGAHERISPDGYLEYVETSGRDPAP